MRWFRRTSIEDKLSKEGERTDTSWSIRYSVGDGWQGRVTGAPYYLQAHTKRRVQLDVLSVLRSIPEETLFSSTPRDRSVQKAVEFSDQYSPKSNEIPTRPNRSETE